MKTGVGPAETDSSGPGRTVGRGRSALQAHHSFKRRDRFVCSIKEQSRRSFSESQEGVRVTGMSFRFHWQRRLFFRNIPSDGAVCLLVAFLSSLLRPSALLDDGFPPS